MSVWFILWLLLSCTLLYFLGWTLYILLRQKQVWKNFAAQKKLRFRTASLLSPPEMSGTMDSYPISIFIGEHMSADARSSRKLTALEVRLGSKMPFEGGVASGGMVPMIHNLRLKEEIRPDHPKWDKNYIAAASNRLALQAYLNNERLEALTSLMKIRNAWVILIFRGDMLLLRFDTPDPLDTQDKLEKITRKILDTARLLELKSGEDSLLKSEMAKKPPKEVNIAVDSRDFSEASTFALEDEKPPEEKK